MGPTEVFSCLCITSLISSRPPFSGLGNVTACLRRRKPIWEGLGRGVVICWVCYAKDGDKSSSPGIQQPFPSENGILVLSWGCAVTPSLFQRMVTPFPLLLIAVCTSVQHIPQSSSCLAHWCAHCAGAIWFAKPRTEKLGNIRCAFAHATWNLPTHVSVHWVMQGCWWIAWSLSQNQTVCRKRQGRPCLKELEFANNIYIFLT